MIESEETKRLKSILKRAELSALHQLRTSDDIRKINFAQAKLDLIDDLTTQFFTEQKPPNERTTLRI